MVAITRLTSSGQLTMPAEVRRELGLSAGDSVLWTKDAQGNLIVRPMRLSLDDLDGFLPVIDHPSAETDFEDMIADAQEDLVDINLREIGEIVPELSSSIRTSFFDFSLQRHQRPRSA